MTRRDDDTILALHHLGELPPALRKRARDLLATPEGARRLAELEREAGEGPTDAEVRTALDGIRQKLAVPPAPDRRLPIWSFSAAGAMLCATILVVLADPFQPRTAGQAQENASTPLPATSRPTESVAEGSPAGSLRPATPATRGSTRLGPAATEGGAPPEVVAMAEARDDGLRTKGGSARLQVFRILPGGTASMLRDGDSATTGTIVQVAVTSADAPTWIVVLSIDGAGSITRHVPETGDSAVPAGGGIQPPHAFRIDDAPAFERFVLFRAGHPFALSEALGELRDDVPRRPTDLAAQSILLIKNKAVDR